MYVATYVVTYIKITSYGSLDVHRAATITVCNPTYVHILDRCSTSGGEPEDACMKLL